MALFGRDYDRDYGRDFEPGANTSGRWNQGPRPHNGYLGGGRADTWSGADDREYYRSMRGYTGGDAGASQGRGYANMGYDRGMRAGSWGRGYDRDYDRQYKSQWQTDYGDPFGDRQSNTPMRVIRGGFDERYDREHRDRENRGGWFGGGNDRYERDYSSNPMGYDPYRGRESSMERGWGMRDMNRGGRYGRDFRNDWY